MRKKILFIAGMMACCTWASAQEISRTWVADKGDGTYQNPVLYADYSDPDVCAAGDDFYMTASSFNCIPGLPILHSRDLVNWSLVNYALPVQEPKEFFDKAQHGKGVWAPAIRFHKGEFYIYWGDPDYGIYMIKTRDPKGISDTCLCRQSQRSEQHSGNLRIECGRNGSDLRSGTGVRRK